MPQVGRLPLQEIPSHLQPRVKAFKIVYILEAHAPAVDFNWIEKTLRADYYQSVLRHIDSVHKVVELYVELHRGCPRPALNCLPAGILRCWTKIPQGLHRNDGIQWRRPTAIKAAPYLLSEDDIGDIEFNK